MKPSFALNFTDEGVTLLHRTARGWLDVGHVAFDNTDLPAALDYLRSTALGLSPKGITTKLVIPNSQILYLDVIAHGPDKASKEAQIAAALEGRTPYDVSELAYDWAGEGDTVRVAIVAKETLAEAEAFASEHRFNPLSFAAIPPDTFPHEPFFGPSQMAPSLLPKGQNVERDLTPIEIVTREMPKAEVEPDVKADVEPATAPLPEQVTEAAPEAAPAPEPSAVAQEVLAAEEPLPAEPEVAHSAPEQPVEAPPPAKEPVAEEPVASKIAVQEPATSEPIVAPEPAAVPSSEPVATPPVAEAAAEPVASPPAAASVAPQAAPSVARPDSATTPAAAPIDDADEAPMAVDVPLEETPVAARKPSVLTAELDDVPPAPSNATLMAFASRRAAESAAKSGEKPARVVPLPALGGAVAAPAMPKPVGAKPVAERPPAASRPTPKFSYDDPVPPPPRLPGDPPAASVGVMSKAGKGLRNLSTLVSAPSMPGARKKNAAAAVTGAAPTASPAAQAAAPKATDPRPTLATSAKITRLADVERPAGAAKPALVEPDALARGLGARAVPQRGKPRYLGLIMTGILLLMLAIVAAWSSFFLAQNDATPTDAVVVASADQDGAIGGADVPATDEEIQADLEAEAAVPPETAPSEPQTSAEIAVPTAVEPEVLSNEAPTAELAATETEVAVTPSEPAPQTGVETDTAVAAQPGIEGQDEIFLAGMDAPPSFSDPLVLTAPAAIGDLLLGPQMPPPPFGTVYQFDENGMIQPTADGIVTPEGVRLVAGRPPVLPPQRPAAIETAATPTPAAAATAPEAAAAATEVTPEQTFAADPALRDARPRVRPAGLAPAAPAVGEDDASLAPAEGSRFASLRPRLRPQTILAAGEDARRESEAASLAVQAAAAAAAQSVIDEQAQRANLSPMAVTVSRVPAPRPRDLSKAVEVAVAAATRQSEPRATAKTQEPAQDEADDEPEVASSAAPRIPTRANVAKQATFVNAINLSKTNLIGVYGTQSKRYALIRQSNGRYKKVRVGDSVDGGKVQAITANEVRYQKGGRLLSLTMPKT